MLYGHKEILVQKYVHIIYFLFSRSFQIVQTPDYGKQSKQTQYPICVLTTDSASDMLQEHVIIRDTQSVRLQTAASTKWFPVVDQMLFHRQQELVFT